MMLFIKYFTLALITSFLGSVPFGTVNLSVVDTTIKESFKAGMFIAIAASLVEIVFSLFAVQFGMRITDYIEKNQYIKLSTILVFISLGLIFFFRKQREPNTDKPKKKQLNFLKGLFLATINPQVLPYWILIITYLQTTYMLDLNIYERTQYVVIFLFGVWLGKILALYMYGKLSIIIQKKAVRISKLMNKIIGCILFFIGIFQLVKLLVT